jgi:hypothetical protein
MIRRAVITSMSSVVEMMEEHPRVGVIERARLEPVHDLQRVGLHELDTGNLAHVLPGQLQCRRVPVYARDVNAVARPLRPSGDRQRNVGRAGADVDDADRLAGRPSRGPARKVPDNRAGAAKTPVDHANETQ